MTHEGPDESPDEGLEEAEEDGPGIEAVPAQGSQTDPAS